MLDIRAHMEQCDACHAECHELQQTKRLLSSLSSSTPRAELEQLLMVRAERATNPKPLDRILPPEWSDAMLWRFEGIGNLASPRLRPLAATALLSLTGLCLATATVNRPVDESPFGNDSTGQLFAVYVGPTGTLTRIPIAPDMYDSAPLPSNVAVPSSFSGAGNAFTSGWQTMATPVLPVAYRRENQLPVSWQSNPSPSSPSIYSASDNTNAKIQFSLLIIAGHAR